MRRALRMSCAVAVFAGVLAPLSAQELEEVFCENDPMCTEDNLSITFPGDRPNANIFEYDPFVQDMPINAVLNMDTKSTMVQGWSIAVEHIEGDVEIAATFDEPCFPPVFSCTSYVGTDAAQVMIDAQIFSNFFIQNKIVRNVLPDGEVRVGLITAIVLDFVGPAVMKVQPNSILNIPYILKRDVCTAGTRVNIVSGRIGVEGSPLLDINITDAGLSKLPARFTHGLIKLGGDGPPPPTGCPDGTPANGLYFNEVDPAAQPLVGDTVSIISRNDASLLGFQLGVAVATAGGSQTWTFSGDLGTNDANGTPKDPIDLLLAKGDGTDVEPAKGNTLTIASTDPITSVSRGAATAGFVPGDFFAVELAPDFGGPGFFVGYVADVQQGDINKVIPATPSPADACPSNELVKVTVGAGVRYSRGDASGDGKIAVTDAVLIIQNAVGNVPRRFDCTAALDANGDLRSDLSDGVFLLNYIFMRNSPIPPDPFRTCQIGPGDCAVSNCA